MEDLTGGIRRAFARRSVPWAGTDHLAYEAVVAYVDGELRMNAHLRAGTHLAQCPMCAAEVEAQRQARTMLRESGEITIPHRLLGQLNQIPTQHAQPAQQARPAVEPTNGPVSGFGGFPTPVPAHRDESGKRGRRRDSR
jgi:anti-sigma factor RsiW